MKSADYIIGLLVLRSLLRSNSCLGDTTTNKLTSDLDMLRRTVRSLFL